MASTLGKAGCLKGSLHSSFSKFRTTADYFRSTITYGEILATNLARESKNMSSNTRNALPVVAVLIITATYQASLSPPGGVWQQGDNNSNPNSSGNPIPGTTVMKSNTFRLFTTYNTLTLWSTLLLITFLLPSGFPSYLLLLPLSVLGFCYTLSMNVLSPNPDWFPMNLLVSSWIAISVFVVFKLSVRPEYYHRSLSTGMKIFLHRFFFLFVRGIIRFTWQDDVFEEITSASFINSSFINSTN